MIDAEQADPGSHPRVESAPTAPPARRLSHDTLLFGLGSLAGKAIALLTLPVFARLLSPEQFGRLDVLNAMVSAGLVTLLLGTDVAATRLYFDRHTPEARRQLLGTWYVLGAAVISPLALALIVTSEPLSRLMFGTTKLSLAISSVGVALLAGMIYMITLGVLRTTGRPRDYALLEGGALVINGALAVLLLVVWRADAAAVMLALAISWSGAAIIGVASVWNTVASRPDRAAASALLRLGLPLAPAVAATWGADFFNRAFLLAGGGAAQAGYLSIAIRIASVAGLAVLATQLAWQPHAYRMGSSPAALGRLGIQARRILIALAVCVALLGLLAPEIVALVGAGRYADARPAVGWCLIGILGTGLFAVGSLPSVMARATREMGFAILVGAAVGVVLNVGLASSLGASGTALAIASGQVLTGAVAVILGRRHQRLPVAWRRVGLVIALATAAVIVATLPPELPLAIRAVLGVILIVGLFLEGTLPASVDDARRRARESQ